MVFYSIYNGLNKQTDSVSTIETHIEVAAVTPGSINAAAEEDVVTSPAREELCLAPTSLNDLLMARKERLIVSCGRQKVVVEQQKKCLFFGGGLLHDCSWSIGVP